MLNSLNQNSVFCLKNKIAFCLLFAVLDCEIVQNFLEKSVAFDANRTLASVSDVSATIYYTHKKV